MILHTTVLTADTITVLSAELAIDVVVLIIERTIRKDVEQE